MLDVDFLRSVVPDGALVTVEAKLSTRTPSAAISLRDVIAAVDPVGERR